jgi:cellulose synthase/poly-beta-1,6-N-acetylglucosamine synthase-like glycosyltransferase
MVELLVEAYCWFGIALLLLLLIRTAYISIYTPTLRHTSGSTQSSVDVLVPVRNEGKRNLKENIHALVNQSHVNSFIIVTDDCSTDESPVILSNIERNHPNRIKVILGKSKPKEWIGKTFALEQAKQASSADWLAMVDADVLCEKQIIHTALEYTEKHSLDALCILPQFIYRSFWVGVVLPAMIWLTVMRVSPTQTNRRSSQHAFGFGNFILVRRAAHESIGGFEAYRSAVLDDCEIFERLKFSGFVVRIVHGPSFIQSPMYDNITELWNGFSKNSFAAIRYSWIRLLAIVIVIVSVLTLPVVAVITSRPELCGIAIALVFLIGIVCGFRVNAPPYFYLLFPLGLLLSTAIVVQSALVSISHVGASWKGRTVV